MSDGLSRIPERPWGKNLSSPDKKDAGVPLTPKEEAGPSLPPGQSIHHPS